MSRPERLLRHLRGEKTRVRVRCNMRQSSSVLFPEIPEIGPAVLPTMVPFTREDEAYWHVMPDDHNDSGLFDDGPAETRSAFWFALERIAPSEREAYLARVIQEHARRGAIRRRVRLSRHL